MKVENTRYPDMPAVQTWRIDTTPEHLAGFAYQHALEFSTRSIRPAGKGWLLEGMDGMETYELQNVAVFGPRPVIVDVTSIKRKLARKEVPFQMLRLDLTKEWVDYIIETCQVENEGVERHDAESIKRPGILMDWGGGHTSTIDGSHRLVKSWRIGPIGAATFEMAMVFAPWVVEHVCRKGEEEQLFRRMLEARGDGLS